VDTATVYTKVTPSAKASSFNIDTIVGDAKFIAVFEVLQEDLTNGNQWISCDVTDSGGSQLGAVIAIGHNASEEPAYSQAV
jgi:hypothetical protein